MNSLRAQIDATIPADSDGRRDWCRAAIEAIADVILQHAEGDVRDAARGFEILAVQGIASLGTAKQRRTTQ